MWTFFLAEHLSTPWTQPDLVPRMWTFFLAEHLSTPWTQPDLVPRMSTPWTQPDLVPRMWTFFLAEHLSTPWTQPDLVPRMWTFSLAVKNDRVSFLNLQYERNKLCPIFFIFAAIVHSWVGKA